MKKDKLVLIAVVALMITVDNLQAGWVVLR
jgi:hypothetical protein